MNTVIYDQATGQIKRTIRATVAEDALAVESGEIALEVFDDEPVLMNMRNYRVENEEIIAKAEVTLTRDIVTFNADGVSEGRITFSGLTQTAIVRIDNSFATITVADPILILTSDVSHLFIIQLEDLYHWSKRITIEAI